MGDREIQDFLNVARTRRLSEEEKGRLLQLRGSIDERSWFEAIQSQIDLMPDPDLPGKEKLDLVRITRTRIPLGDTRVSCSMIVGLGKALGCNDATTMDNYWFSSSRFPNGDLQASILFTWAKAKNLLEAKIGNCDGDVLCAWVENEGHARFLTGGETNVRGIGLDLRSDAKRNKEVCIVDVDLARVDLPRISPIEVDPKFAYLRGRGRAAKGWPVGLLATYYRKETGESNISYKQLLIIDWVRRQVLQALDVEHVLGKGGDYGVHYGFDGYQGAVAAISSDGNGMVVLDLLPYLDKYHPVMLEAMRKDAATQLEREGKRKIPAMLETIRRERESRKESKKP